ncbi:GreA/GreB family elongation factor [Alkalimarinus alittae]|uniref:GreA/GreB family elongation factor n=1 Tax=Alkalimarinus alittae TaxID=2961619 RepID=A0ABY6MZU7_9ALTE|nr:GreA/GreB family elongation factor [Alkalimarinus alittae]UZE95287.1 GreA/GreB family elongation factor [Alkalimarinus alittae]
MIIKETIRQGILRQLRTDYENAIRSASAAHEAATNEESKAENKYDTRGLEASYLAEGQSRRVTELEEEIAVYEKLELADFTEASPIRLTALVVLEDNKESRQLFFVGPLSGGLKVVILESGLKGECLVVTAKAPLGSALIGKRVGDEVVINIAGNTACYDIIDVY